MSPDTTKCKSILAIASWEWPKLFNKKNGISLTLSKYPRLEKYTRLKQNPLVHTKPQ